jgi:hypothetical protein
MWVWQERKFKCVLIFEVAKKRKFASIKYMFKLPDSAGEEGAVLQPEVVRAISQVST